MHFLDLGALEQVRKAREALGPFLKDTAKFAPSRASMTDRSPILKTLAIAFCTQTAIYHGGLNEYETVHENVHARLSPGCCLLDRNFEWVVYTSLQLSGDNIYLEIVSPINPEWFVVSVYR